MTLQQLRLLAAVVEHRSYTRGARAVFMTQSAASQHIRALEGALGTQLVTRVGGEVAPTRAGEALLGYARSILRLADDAERFVGALRDGAAGRLVLGASGSAVYLVPGLVAGFRAAHPGIEVSLEVRPRGALGAAVASGVVDVAITGGPVHELDLPDLATLEARPLCPDRLVLAVSNASPLLPAAALGPCPLARLAGEQIVAVAEPSPAWRLVEHWAAAHGTQLRPAMRLDSVDAAKKAVEAGMGVAFLSAWVVEREVTLGTLRVVPLDPPGPTRRYELLSRRPQQDTRAASSGALEAFLRFAPDFLARHVPAVVLPAGPGGLGHLAEVSRRGRPADQAQAGLFPAPVHGVQAAVA